MNFFTFIFIFIFFIPLTQAQTFTGEVNSLYYLIDVNKRSNFTDENDKMIIDSSKATTYSNIKICGDTLIRSTTILSKKKIHKSIQIGKKAFVKSSSRGTYFTLKIPPSDLSKFENKDWKKAKGQYKKDGFELYAVSKKAQNIRHYVTIDERMNFPGQFELGHGFSAIFHSSGVKKMYGARFNDTYKLEWLEYYPNKNLVCKNYMKDFWVDESREIDWEKENKDSKTSRLVIPRSDRHPLPPAEFQNEFEEPVFLDQFSGKYVYIDLWASWCAPCRSEMPFTKKIRDKYQDQGLEVVSISLDKEAALPRWKAMIENLEMNWHNWHLKYDFGSSLATELKVKGIPRYILLDPEGKIINDNAPRPSDAGLIEFLDKVLNQ